MEVVRGVRYCGEAESNNEGCDEDSAVGISLLPVLREHFKEYSVDGNQLTCFRD